MVMRRDGYMCQLSKRYGRAVPAEVVHHIFPVNEYPEYAYEPWNLIALSRMLHNIILRGRPGKPMRPSLYGLGVNIRPTAPVFTALHGGTMANVSTQVKETVYKIARWKGVNEAQEGEASLKMGEAAVMRNFRVTAGGALKKRGGSQTVAGLLAAYNVNVNTGDTQVLRSDTGSTSATWTMYPNCSVDGVGNLSLSGESVTVNSTNASSYVGYYYKDSAGKVYRFAGLEVTS